jgi:two-component system sensor histidine kinase CreC
VRAQAQKRGLSLHHDLGAGDRVTGERFLIRQALANLLDNAVDFTPAGGRVAVSGSTASLPGGAPALVVHVRNDGEAIPEFALPRLTERFYSLPRPATGRKSTGLGLNFVAEVAALHGGALEVVNVPGGVEARLTLPTHSA